MTRYFMRDTPLSGLERIMMSTPNFTPRGHGLYISGVHLSVPNTECQYCERFCRRSPCPLHQCKYLAERIEAGDLGLGEVIHDCFSGKLPFPVQDRLGCHIQKYGFCFFRDGVHQKRWQYWRDRYYKMSPKCKAALLLLTAYQDLWERVIWKFDNSGFDFSSVSVAGIRPELYSVYQAAKTIVLGGEKITVSDLAHPDLVTDEAFQLIIGALLLTKYGEAILTLQERKGEISK